jgi:hypothetical protein
MSKAPKRFTEGEETEAAYPDAQQTPLDEAPPESPRITSINEPPGSNVIPGGGPNELPDAPKPTISAIDPDGCSIGDPDFTLHVSGENFFAGSVIHFAGHDEPTTFDTTAKTLSTGVKPSLWLEPVTVQVQIRNGPEMSAPVDFEFQPIARSSTRKK